MYKHCWQWLGYAQPVLALGGELRRVDPVVLVRGAAAGGEHVPHAASMHQHTLFTSHSRLAASCAGSTQPHLPAAVRRRQMHHHTLFTSHSRLAASCAGSTQSYLSAARRRAASTCPHAASTCAKHPAAS